MSDFVLLWIALDVALHLAGAAGFLLLGWRLGRESAGRPMFDYPTRPAPLPRPDADAPLEEADPWSAAAITATQHDRRPAMVDIFETLAPRRPFNVDQGTP
ncbi:MAG: hypothetical protein B193_1187 [Solidesulfovibrio magneticus str. Maddingley MBC34]|uniref:Uncharacterized protein n=1 Tax=Solidesulfovibrio magneticus str. Maddingley MBC34 TaxID=1206767 RepID=K6HC99_9BACT|nr:MAG: hypothetical protein B193_1187 [Solidesulfovibrio magneticus str. Maddingley MBC34]